MRILGVDLGRASDGEHTLVSLDEDGSVAGTERAETLPAVAAAVGRLVGEEPFLLGVNVPVVVPARAARARAVENLVRRRFGVRMPPGGRAALSGGPVGLAGEALIAGLAAAGRPCLPYPDRDGQNSGLAEIHPGLILKSLLWESSSLGDSRDRSTREELFRAYSAPAYRGADLSSRARWTDQAVAIDRLLRLLATVEGYDLDSARGALARASSATEIERVGSALDASLIAGTVRRYVQAPETCLFLGDPSDGYIIVPADSFIRRLAASETRPQEGNLFPQTSLRERLGAGVKLRSVDLLDVPGRPHRLDASFSDPPRYEFDNLDEMLWWKHCRHLAGSRLPTEGLHELVVEVGDGSDGHGDPLRLVRSRHRTLSFRFDPPAQWRKRVPPRDGRTYPIRVVRAIYETLPPGD